MANDIQRQIENLGPKPQSGGITADCPGGVMKLEPDGRLITLAKDPAKIR